MDDRRSRIESGWQAFQQALEGLPDELLTQPGVAGDWSVKDLLAHLAFWHESMVEIATVRARGGDIPGPDVEALNQREGEARANWPLQQARDEAQRTHLLVLETALAIPDIDPELLEGDTWGHYEEHTADVRAWRERLGR
jgi:hypothetical protein